MIFLSTQKLKKKKLYLRFFESVNRDDLWVQHDVMIKHFKENFQ